MLRNAALRIGITGTLSTGQNLEENASRQICLATDLETPNAENSQIIVRVLTFGGQFSRKILNYLSEKRRYLYS
ncbi:MAG: hypothetical protein KME05_03405 [Gloeocapsa sp. UFS-A4-WI-NPMV-4B04]|nr:hypothetical protein [Gloeocapsa sp. UFS-A4-WI-NPMV-4B04]